MGLQRQILRKRKGRTAFAQRCRGSALGEKRGINAESSGGELIWKGKDHGTQMQKKKTNTIVTKTEAACGANERTMGLYGTEK